MRVAARLLAVGSTGCLAAAMLGLASPPALATATPATANPQASVAAARPAWSPVSGAHVRGRQAQFAGVSCSAGSACVAVGSYAFMGGVRTSLVAAGRGRKWTLQRIPRPPRGGMLSGVSCTSASACTAVENQNSGLPTALAALRWNGRKWASQAMPILAGVAGISVAGVSCASRTSCVAVGAAASDEHELPLAETWNGHTWAASALPVPAGAAGAFLSGVSCVSRTSCVAVGTGLFGVDGNELPLAETWNGHTWAALELPVPAGALRAGLSGVSCVSRTSCVAVGDYTRHSGIGHTLTEARHGQTWVIQATPSPAGILRSSLSGVSCSSAAACLAVGTATRAGPGRPPVDRPLVEAWNGRAWAVRPMPDPAGTQAGGLSGVSCRSATACSVAGHYTRGRGPTFRQLTLAETWNGRTWAIHHTPSPAGILRSSLSGVSCSSAAACVAVGSYIDPSGLQETLAESWDGRRWVVHPTPFPLRHLLRSSFLAGVSCSSPAACMAIGGYGNFGAHLLAEVWNGRRWAIRRPPIPAGARSSSLSAVSCTSAAACTAAGSYVDQAGHSLMLAEAWNGTRWAIQRTPRPPAGTGFSIDAVSCTSARACTAVGVIQVSPPGSLQATTLAQRWNGKTWTVQPTPRRSQLVGVSCTSRKACTAVGFSSLNVMLAEVWNGTRWAVQPTPSSPPGSDPLIRGLSCASARDCAAVGETSVAGSGLAVSWNGRRWAIQPVPRPGDSQRTRLELFGVSCTPAACMAVGEYVNRLGQLQPLVERRR